MRAIHDYLQQFVYDDRTLVSQKPDAPVCSNPRPATCVNPLGFLGSSSNRLRGEEVQHAHLVVLAEEAPGVAEGPGSVGGQVVKGGRIGGHGE